MLVCVSFLSGTTKYRSLYQDAHKENTKLCFHYGDLTDAENLASLIQNVRLYEICNLDGMSHDMLSFDPPEYFANVDRIGIW